MKLLRTLLGRRYSTAPGELSNVRDSAVIGCNNLGGRSHRLHLRCDVVIEGWPQRAHVVTLYGKLIATPAHAGRRSGSYYWSFTDLGEEHKGNRGYETLVEAAQEADQYHRQLKLARHFKKQKEARLAASQSL